MGRRQGQGEEKEVKERVEGSFIGLHHCDGHTAVTCCWRDFVALALHHRKMARKLVMEPVTHKTQTSSLAQAHYLQRHTHTPTEGILYILFTHTETHSSTQTHE